MPEYILRFSGTTRLVEFYAAHSDDELITQMIQTIELWSAVNGMGRTNHAH